MKFRFSWSESTQGFFCALVSSLFYAFSLALLRLMTNYRSVSSDWSLFVKESVSVAVVGLYILISTLRGRYRFPAFRWIALVLFAGLCSGAFGARAHLAAYAVIGLILTGPLIQAFQIIMTTAFGTFFLHEALNKLKIATIVILISAVALLGVSPFFSQNISPDGESGEFQTAEFSLPGGSALVGGLLLTLAAGSGYALQVSLVRGTMLGSRRTDPASGSTPEPMPVSLVVFLITGIGMVTFGLFLWFEQGPAAFYQVPSECWSIALGSGVMNLAGFYFQNRGIVRIPASKVSMIAVAQIFLLTIFGIVFFGEPANPAVWTGLLLTVVGVIGAGVSK